MCTSRVHAHPRKNIKIDSAGVQPDSLSSNPGTLRNKVEKEKREFRIEFLQPFSKNSIEKQRCLFPSLFPRIKDEVKGRVISPPPLSNASCQRKFPYSFRYRAFLAGKCPGSAHSPGNVNYEEAPPPSARKVISRTILPFSRALLPRNFRVPSECYH